MGKVNLKAIKTKGVADNNILEKVTPKKQIEKPKPVKKPKKEYVTAQVKINMTPEEKERLLKKAGYNVSAFLRDELKKLKLI